MNFASKYCYKKQNLLFKNQENPNQFNRNDRLDTNIVQITFENTKEQEKNIALGDPVFCQNCQAILNKHSLIEKQQQGKQKWVCEFCSHENQISIENEEIPTQEEIIYMLQGFQEQNLLNNQKQEDISVVFVIDISGSMSVTQQIKNKDSLKYKHNSNVTDEEFEALKQFMDPEDIQQYIQMQQKSQQFISRKQCVLAAIQQQLEDISQQNPLRKIGLVVFNDDVTIFGSGDKEPITISGDKLYNFDSIYNIATEKSDHMLSLKAPQCKEKIISIFEKLKESGKTALGPALVSALGLCSKQPKGSTIILCTDGLANVGIGAFDQKNDSQPLYEKIKDMAVQNDTIINIISIKGEGCKLDILGQLADKTGGNVTRVDPENIHKDFANILEDEVVAFKTSIKIYIKNTMKFRNLDQINDILDKNGLQCTKKIGNATVKTVQTFEYTSKSPEELKEQGIDENEEKELPFQVQIQYTNKQNQNIVRVITKQQQVTENKEVAEQEMDVGIVQQRIQAHTAALIYNKNYKEAEEFNDQWADYHQNNQYIPQIEQQKFSSNNRKLKSVTQNKIMKVEKEKKNTQMLFEQDNQIIEQNEDLFASNTQKDEMKMESKVKKSSGNSFLNKVSNLFKGSSNKSEQQKPLQKQKAQEKKLKDQEEEDEQDDEDFEEAMIIQYKNKK